MSLAAVHLFQLLRDLDKLHPLIDYSDKRHLEGSYL